jgi:hypothetical protein
MFLMLRLGGGDWLEKGVCRGAGGEEVDSIPVKGLDGGIGYLCELYTWRDE